MFNQELIQENKHLILWAVIIFCAYLLYQKHQGKNISQDFSALPLLGGAAYGLNFLITLIK